MCQKNGVEIIENEEDTTDKYILNVLLITQEYVRYLSGVISVVPLSPEHHPPPPPACMMNLQGRSHYSHVGCTSCMMM